MKNFDIAFCIGFLFKTVLLTSQPLIFRPLQYIFVCLSLVFFIILVYTLLRVSHQSVQKQSFLHWFLRRKNHTLAKKYVFVI